MGTTTTTLITGNTYPHRDALRAMGGRWDADAKGWRVPAERTDEARRLVTSGRARTERRDTAPRQPQPRYRAPCAGERLIYRPSAGRHDTGYEVGEIVRMRDEYWIVVVPQGRYRVGQEDDTHEGEWRCAAIARRATESEAAARRAADKSAARKRAAQQDLRAAVDAMPSMGRSATLPEWATQQSVAHRIRLTSVTSQTIYRASEGVASYYPVYDDDPVIRVALAGTPEYERVVAALDHARLAVEG